MIIDTRNPLTKYENSTIEYKSLKNAHDDELLKIKGIGNIQLKKIRND